MLKAPVMDRKPYQDQALIEEKIRMVKKKKIKVQFKNIKKFNGSRGSESLPFTQKQAVLARKDMRGQRALKPINREE